MDTLSEIPANSLGEKILENAHIPALSVSWRQKNRIQTFACGIRDTAEPGQVDRLTLFQAASLSKVVSAAMVLDLVEKNLLNLKMPLSLMGEYGPPEIQQDPNYEKLTIRMVLGQCSGLPNWFYPGEPIRFVDVPGKQFNYSGVAYEFLKEVIERQFGKKWERLAQEFFAKVGMENSTFTLPASHLEGKRSVARAHHADGNPYPLALGDCPEIPAASLLTTANDYMIFLRYCLANDFLKATLMKEKTRLNQDGFPLTPEAPNLIQWGLGMGIFTDAEKKVAFHWGNNPGSDAFCAMNLKTGDSIACFVNSANGPNVFQQLAETVVGDLKPVFQWLSTYCQFNAGKESQSPETIRELFQSLSAGMEKGSWNHQASFDASVKNLAAMSIFPVGQEASKNDRILDNLMEFTG